MIFNRCRLAEKEALSGFLSIVSKEYIPGLVNGLCSVFHP